MTSSDAKYFDPTIRKTLQELNVAEALTAYDARRNELILAECVATLRRCATLLEQGKDLSNELFIHSPAGDHMGIDNEILVLTPQLSNDYDITITAEDFIDYNPFVPSNYDPLDAIFKGHTCK